MLRCRPLLLFCALLASLLVTAGDVLDTDLAAALHAVRSELVDPASRSWDQIWLRAWSMLADATGLDSRSVASCAAACFAAGAVALIAATRNQRPWTALLVAACPAVWLHASGPGPATFLLAAAAGLDAALRSGRWLFPAVLGAGLAVALEPQSLLPLVLVSCTATGVIAGPRLRGSSAVAIALFAISVWIAPSLRAAAADDALRAFFPLSWFVLFGAIRREGRHRLMWILLACWPALAHPSSREGAALIALTIPLADAAAGAAPAWRTILVLTGVLAGILRVGAHDLGPEARSWQSTLNRILDDPTHATIVTQGEREYRLLNVAAPRSSLLKLDELLELCASFDDHLPTTPGLEQAFDVWVADLRSHGRTLILTRSAEEHLRDRGTRVRHRQAVRLLDELRARFGSRTVIDGAFDAKVLTPH